jgi:hypothetical protein
MTDLNDTNESFVTSANSYETQGMDTFFGNFMTKMSSIIDPRKQSEFTAYTQTLALSNMPITTDDAHIWSLYFDGSKFQEGAGVGCVLINPTSNKTFISCRLEFECTNNTTEYEALLQALRKELDMDVKNLIAFSNSKFVVK